MVLYNPTVESRRIQQLSPSLVNRIAVQITPPAPYVIDLPEQTVILPRFQQVTFPVLTTRAPGLPLGETLGVLGRFVLSPGRLHALRG